LHPAVGCREDCLLASAHRTGPGLSGRQRCYRSRQRRGRFFEMKNRPRANPVRGLGVTGIAESRCDGEVGCPMLDETTTRCISLPNVDSVKICLPATATPVKLNIDIVNI